MFQTLKNQEAGQKPGIREFLALYAKFQAGAAWLTKRQASGQDISRHLADFRRLEAQVDTEWDNMDEGRKDDVLGVLRKLYPLVEEACQAKDLFGGQVVGLT